LSDQKQPAYASSIDTEQAAAALAQCRSALVLTHAKPDGDATGSSLAITRTLLALGKKVETWYIGPFPAWLDLATGATAVSKIGSTDGLPAPAGFDLIVVVDTGSWSQLDLIARWLKGNESRTMILDHHLNGNVEIADRRLIVPVAASTTQLIAPIVAAALGLPGPRKLPLDIATPLYMGMATDTGWFKFSNATADTFRMAAELLDAGVNATDIYEMIEQQNNPSRPKLLGRALSSLEFDDDGRYVKMSLTLKDFDDVGAETEDSGGFAEHALSVHGVQVVVTLNETTREGAFDPLTKVSMRSKPGPKAIDVASACAKLGGGGHARAAGVKLQMELREAAAAVDAVIRQALRSMDSRIDLK